MPLHLQDEHWSWAFSVLSRSENMPIHLPSERSPAQALITPAKPALVVGSIAGKSSSIIQVFLCLLESPINMIPSIAVAGLGFGSFRAVLTGRRPVIAALAVGGTWFGFASVFWCMYHHLAVLWDPIDMLQTRGVVCFNHLPVTLLQHGNAFFSVPSPVGSVEESIQACNVSFYPDMPCMWC